MIIVHGWCRVFQRINQLLSHATIGITRYGSSPLLYDLWRCLNLDLLVFPPWSATRSANADDDKLTPVYPNGIVKDLSFGCVTLWNTWTSPNSILIQILWKIVLR